MTGTDLDTLRVQTVGRAVSHALGVHWSPMICTMVRAALERMGGRLIHPANRSLVARVRPRHFDDADALRLAIELRKLKRLKVAA